MSHRAQVRQRARGRSTPDMGGLNRKDKDLGRNSLKHRDQDSEIFGAPYRRACLLSRRRDRNPLAGGLLLLRAREMSYRFGHTCQQIADTLGCPRNTVKTRMFHGRRKLRQLLPKMAVGRDCA